jgi:Ca2+-transporting ATPase
MAWTMAEQDAGAGLSEEEAARRLAAEGPNRAPGRRGAAWWEGVADPTVLLLLVAAMVYGVAGDVQDARIVLAACAVAAGLAVWQARRAARILRTLEVHVAARARVRRGGVVRPIPAEEVVRGDRILLAEGDRVPADGVVAVARGPRVDASWFTGESLADEPGPGDRVRAGSLVVAGAAEADVDAIGALTELARLGGSLRTPRPAGPRALQVQRAVRALGLVGAGACVVVVMLHGWVRGDWTGGLLAGIVLGVAVIPEELPVVRNVLLALSAHRLARSGLVARRLDTLETLGAVNVVCIDKTGTLTTNRMTLAAVWTSATGVWSVPSLGRGTSPATPPSGGAASPPEAVKAVLRAAFQASEAGSPDPLERAILDASPDGRDGPAARLADWAQGDGRPLHAHAWRRADGGVQVAAKGAPEALLARCDAPAALCEASLAAAASLAEEGMRVLGVATWAFPATWGPGAEPPLTGGRWEGLVAVADPVRPAAPAAVAALGRMGVRVILVTGDHAGTARAVARAAGLPATRVHHGEALEAMGDAELTAALARGDAWARVRPAQKLRIVQVLQHAGDVVAMTGDGVNDAPALRAAEVGLAMGRGADVARESASVVLVNEDLEVLVAGIAEGRRLADALRGALAWLVSVHAPIAALAVLAPLAGLPLLLLPAHVAAMELFIDPVAALAFERTVTDTSVAVRPPDPDPRHSPLLPRGRLLDVLAGALRALGGAIVVGWVWGASGVAEARTLALGIVLFHGALQIAHLSAGVDATGAGGGIGASSVAARAACVVVAIAIAIVMVWPQARAAFALAVPSVGGVVVLTAVGTWLVAAESA